MDVGTYNLNTLQLEKTLQYEDKEDSAQTKISCMGAHPIQSLLGRRGSNPIKLAYDTMHVGRMAGSVNSQGI